jgi:hypothetical protein
MMNKIALAMILALILVAMPLGAQGNPISQYCGNVNKLGANAIVSVVAPWYCNTINAAAVKVWSNWEPIAIAATLFSFSIAALIIMIGIGIRNDRVRIFGMGELYEAIATATIVILFTFVAALMFGLLPGFFVGSYNPYSYALNNINYTIGQTDGLVAQLYAIGSVDYYYASQVYSTCIAETAFKCQFQSSFFPPIFKYAVVYLFFWPASALIELIVPGLMALNLEFYLIIFMMYAAIPVFLIPGVIFRALIPTRHLGGMLMAIAIGFYFFMPILFGIAFAQIAGTQGGTASQLSAISGALGRYGGCTPGSASCKDAVQNSASPSSPLVEEISTASSAMGAFWLSVLFYPALISAMTYAFITQIAELLGGMARTSSRLRGL